MSSATNQNVSQTRNVFKQRIEIFSQLQNEPLHRLFVVWMIENQTTNSSVDRNIHFSTQKLICLHAFFHIFLHQQIRNKVMEIFSQLQNDPSHPAVCRLDDSKPKNKQCDNQDHFTTEPNSKNRKHQKNRKQTFCCWKVKNLTEQFVVWMIRNQMKNNSTRSYTFQHKNFFVSFQKRFLSNMSSATNQRFTNSKRIQESKSSLSCKMILQVRLFVVWMIQTKKQTAKILADHFTTEQNSKKRKHKEPNTNFLMLKSGSSLRAVLSFGWFETKRRTARKKITLLNTKTSLFGSKNAFFQKCL